MSGIRKSFVFDCDSVDLLKSLVSSHMENIGKSFTYGDEEVNDEIRSECNMILDILNNGKEL